MRNNQEKFEIEKVSVKLPIPTYQVRSMDDPNEGNIKGKFYEHEIVKVNIKSTIFQEYVSM